MKDQMNCDVCGDLVDLREDPLFNEHNRIHYERHVRLSHTTEDAERIIREHYEQFGDPDDQVSS